jgi:epoxyqueuosine reductase
LKGIILEFLNEMKKTFSNRGIALFSTGYVGDKHNDDLKGLDYAITIGMAYPNYIVNQIKSGPTVTYFHQYRTMNANLDSCAIAIQSKLILEGHDALYIPASQSHPDRKYDGLFSHKIAAVRGGLGFIGKNNLFISNEHGAAVRLSTILTNKVLPKNDQVKNKCGDCNRCFVACKSGAIYGKISDDFNRQDVFNPEKCSQYMKEKHKHIGRGSVCGICIGVCPFSNGVGKE